MSQCTDAAGNGNIRINEALIIDCMVEILIVPLKSIIYI